MPPVHRNSQGFASNTPRVSIVLATLDAGNTIARCLRSVVEQEFQDWELLIADGGSKDGTVGVIRDHEAYVAWWQSRPDKGIYDAWNQAIDHAKGEFVCFLGADDAFADKCALGRLFEQIGTTQLDLVTSSGLIANSGRLIRYGSGWDYSRIGRRMVVCHPGLLHRRGLFQEFGTFDPQYRIAGDLDFLLRLPPDLRTLHVDSITTLIESSGVSRRYVLARLREQRQVLARCERYGRLRAYLAWMDKLWRLPIAQTFNVLH